jgi:endonuclease/exonuclease/phosphatase family metal-dependent hydrolase
MSRTVALIGIVYAAAFGGYSSPNPSSEGNSPEMPGAIVRLALFNIRELDTAKILEVDANGRGANPQALAAARIIRRIAPDILVLNEIDHDDARSEEGLDLNARRFRDHYLSGGADGVELPYSYAAPNNTGILSGIDLDGDGHVATDADRGERRHGNDAFGYGTYPGQYSMAVLSRYPIVGAETRSFQRFLWKDLPGNHLEDGLLSPAARAVFRLSSKSHWDLPIDVDGHRLHLFVSHPTPQGFDDEEDRNGRRNFDEIKLWVEYIDGNEALVDDDGRRGGYASLAPFVVVGDLNAAPLREGDGQDGPFRTSVYEGMAAIDQLLRHPRIQESGPHLTSRGAVAHAAEVLGESRAPAGFERSTSSFGAGSRIDYVLPSVGLEILDGGVFWPTPEEDESGAAWAEEASDHRLVWLDLELAGRTTSSR